MAAPTAVDIQTQLSNVNTLINTQLAAMTAGAADISYTLPTGVSVNRQGYLKYLLELQKTLTEMWINYSPTLVVSRGR